MTVQGQGGLGWISVRLEDDRGPVRVYGARNGAVLGEDRIEFVFGEKQSAQVVVVAPR